MDISPTQLFNIAAELALENRMQGHVIAQLTARVAELERAASTSGNGEVTPPDPSGQAGAEPATRNAVDGPTATPEPEPDPAG